MQGKTVFISGASRGIGLAIGKRLAKAGANIIVTGKTTEPHPKLEGTIFTAAEEIGAMGGGQALPIVMNVLEEEQVAAALEQGANHFGSIDYVINNASAISLTPTAMTTMKRFDLMFGINVRGTFMVSKLAIPYLRAAGGGHILTMSPPLNLKPEWFENHLAYSMSKYGMSMTVLGLAEEQERFNIKVNALWPQTTIATAAVRNVLGGEEMIKMSRTPDIVADAAYEILTSDRSGQFCIDEDILREAGMTDFSHYSVTPGTEPLKDLFVE
ncbi:NAD(P)-dependent oxidoreductase [Lewinella sp. W8]|uniref:SDR family oxidoreductase n=1 Tax=Lewinella sp. W8 TaxID=2528208 RepID=UPI0010688127|nr:NAD(P)-dependent oxidoreductase [Lewinella sp. W8]MTB49454.1 SDR family NAD(P)-dependent oxidoreductase [Lewinella sp. W8]